MKTFLGVVLVLVLLSACAAGGWFCWMLEQENRTLRAAATAAEVERARLAAEHGQCAAKVAQTVAAQEAQTFSPDEPITKAEAALMLDRVMNVTSVSYIPLNAELDAATAQACANLTACGVLDGAQADMPLTRGAMARMLSASLAVLEKR